MLKHEHYSTTIEGERNEVDLFVSKADGIQIATGDGQDGIMVNLSTGQAEKLYKALGETINIQKVFSGEVVQK